MADNSLPQVADNSVSQVADNSVLKVADNSVSQVADNLLSPVADNHIAQVLVDKVSQAVRSNATYSGDITVLDLIYCSLVHNTALDSAKYTASDSTIQTSLALTALIKDLYIQNLAIR